jgi:dTDP-4-dehydrorhamnose reductase
MHAELDIGDHHAVMQRLVPIAPELIVNAAAYTDVDGCESEHRRAYRDNGLGPQSLALAARACGAMLIHVSTDYVFDGEKGEPYDELDPPNPLSVYGRSKLAGELFVRSILPESFVVRAGLFFGGKDDRLSRALRDLAAGGSAAGFVDRVGSPTYVKHLAERLLPLTLTGRFGLYHLGGPEPASRYEVLMRAKELGDLPGEVEEQEADKLDLPAARPRYSALTSVLVAELGVPPMPPLDDALRDLLEHAF